MVKRGVQQYSAGLLVVLLLAGVLFFSSFGQTSSVVSAPVQLQLEGGKYVWTASYAVDSDEATTFLSAQKTTLADGTTVTPSSTASISFRPFNSNCVAPISRVRSFSWSSGYVADYYQAGTPSQNISFSVSASKNGVKTKDSPRILDSKSIQSPITFFDDDKNGSIIVTNLGALAGSYSCGSFSDIAVIRVGTSISGRLVSKAGLVSVLSSFDSARAACGFNAVCIAQVTTTFVSQMQNLGPPSGITLTSYNYDFDKLFFMNNDPELKLLGSPVIQVVADAGFYDTVFFTPSEVTKPSLSLNPTTVSVGSSNTAVLTAGVTNTGKKTQVIKVRSSVEKGAITGDTTLTIPAGETQNAVLTITALTTLVDVGFAGSISACSSSSLVGELCDVKPFSVNVKGEPKTPIIPAIPGSGLNLSGSGGCPNGTTSKITTQVGVLGSTTTTECLPSEGAGGGGACFPFLQYKSTRTEGGFNLGPLGNFGGSQVAGDCVTDFGAVAILLILVFGALIYSGKLDLQDLGGSKLIIPIALAVVGYFLGTQIPFIGSISGPLFAVVGLALGAVVASGGLKLALKN